ncbi:serine/threonine-protein kinase [Streptomyces griseosporeus]|uniref:serine/threonine-protein kinase n=1 Tax=Streptomyces griseosporeus TaxID=1910 RepID=UPI0036FC01AB
MRELAPEDPRRLGPFELTARLGEGGMGQVYLGRSPGGRRVAVKTVRAEIAADPRFRERFRREVQAAQRVGGFWTATVVEADPDADVPWVASDYIDAPDLARLVSRDGPLPEPDARRLAVGLAEALWSIHRAGLVHRDLKPSNVLVTQDGPRVIDFGIAKGVEGGPALTSTGHVMGTPGFMSPEQAGGERVGEPSDIFSFGSVLVYATTGAGPFGDGSAPALLYRVVHDEPRLDAMPEGLLRDVAEECLAKAPEDRPTAAELLEWLRQGEYPAAVPETTTAAEYGTAVTVAQDATPDTATRVAPEPAGPAAAPVRVEYSVYFRRRGFGCATVGALTVVAFWLVPRLAGGWSYALLVPLLLAGLVVLWWGLYMLWRPSRGAVEVGADGLTFRMPGIGATDVWHSRWEGVDCVTLTPVVFRGAAKYLAVRVVATPPPDEYWQVPHVFAIRLPPAELNLLRSAHSALNGAGTAVTATMTMFFPEFENARREVGRLHEALLAHAPTRYRPEPGLVKVLLQ